jgi:uncharacterized protein (UPF0261 family)
MRGLQVVRAVGKELDSTDRGEAMKLMHEAAPVFLRALYRTLPFHGVVGLGGSGTKRPLSSHSPPPLSSIRLSAVTVN